MESIRENVIRCLDTADDDEQLIARFEAVARREGIGAYQVILHVLTNIGLEPAEAARCWHQIVAHRGNMLADLGRPVDLRTAICDYFCTINKNLRNPKVIEIHLYEQTVQASRYDSLTGLFNRQALDEALEGEISRARRHEKDLSVIFFDLDDFKEVNDTYGHLAGDQVLKRVAEIIMAGKRREDIAARYGGEEMLVILPETGKQNALVLGERIRREVEAMELKLRGQSLRLTISGGLAAYPIHALDAGTLLKCADKALYNAKGSGKNHIACFAEDRRNFLRVQCEREIVFREVAFEESPASRAWGKNISFGGFLFESQAPLPVGRRLQIKLLTDDRHPLMIIGTVVRSHPIAGGKHEIAVSLSFRDMERRLKHEINQWLRAQRARSPGGPASDVR